MSQELLRQPLVQQLGWTLLHFVWQGAVIAAGFALVQGALPKRLAGLRYWSGCGALLAMLAAVVSTFCTLHERPRPVAQHATALPTAPSSRVAEHTPSTGLPPVSSTAESARTSARDWTSHHLEKAFPWLVSAWLLGVVLFSLRLLIGSWQASQLARHGSEPVEESYFARFDELRRALALSRPVRVVKSVLVEVPTVIGWLRPVILLPVTCLTGLTAPQLESILAHELAHIRRHDYLINLLQNVIETVLFYHPAVWWISHSIRIERENCCDDIAVTLCGNRVCYAKALAALECLRSAPGSLVLAANGGPLLTRIRRISGLPTTTASSRWSRAGGVVIVIVMLLVILPSLAAILRSAAISRRSPQISESSFKPGMTVSFSAQPHLTGPAARQSADYVDAHNQSLIAHWTFDESSGPTAHDSAGAFDGTLSGGATFVAGGVSGNALSLDQASGSLVNMGTSFPGFTQGDFSVVAWIKTLTTAPDSLYLGKHEGGALNGYLLAVNSSSTYGQPNKAFFYGSTLGGGEVISTTTINDGNWHQVVGVYAAGGAIVIYVDGAPVEAVKASEPILPNSAPFLIGGINIGGTPTGLFTGLIDDAQVYNRALSSAEVQFLLAHPGQVLGASLMVVNPSFEVDEVPPGAGYGAITGWTPGGGIATDYGINVFGMPFADNGAIPHGTKVAFLQHNGTLSQDVSGFRLGAQYWLTYGENARLGCCGGTATLTVTVGESTVVPEHPVKSVGDTNPYRSVESEVFTARDETLRVTFLKGGDGDVTPLIDLVQIVEIPPGTPPGITQNPKAERADPGESVTFAGAAVGTAPMFFQWWFNGTPLSGETNNTLTLTEVSPQDAGAYWFVVTNEAGSARSSDATLKLRIGVPVVINPSFEIDAVPPHPGYGTISGWTPDTAIEGDYGINPMNGAFADNGAIPHGAKVAFMQHNGTLRQTVSGFRVGTQYWLSYRENARQNCCGEREATLSVTVGGTRVVPEHAVAIVGGVNPYRLVTSQLFTATETELTITFEKGGTGDATALIDDVRLLPRDSFAVAISREKGNTRAIHIDGAPGQAVIIEYKDSLAPSASWQTLTNAQLTDWSAVIVDADAPPLSQRFYRAQQAP